MQQQQHDVGLVTMSSKRKSHPVKIASDSHHLLSGGVGPAQQQLGTPPPLYRPALAVRQQQMSAAPAPDPDIVAADDDVDEEVMDVDGGAAAAEAPAAGGRKQAEHRESMNEILKKLALKSQENIMKAKEENSR